MQRTNGNPATLAQGLTLALMVMLTMLAAGGCRPGPEIIAGVRDSTFVATMIELRRLDGAVAMDSAARAQARAGILQRRGLTAAQLERAASALADDPSRAQALFSTIDSAAAKRDTAAKR